MTENNEQVLKVAREYPLGCGFIMKTILTLGLYLIWWSSRRLIVTNRRVVWREGLLSKKERSIPLSRVQDVSVSCGPIGRILRYGDIAIESAGGPGTEIAATGITDPEGVKDAIVRQLS